MSRGQWKDFFAEIRKSMNRYLSILFMVALGTAFFAGLKSSEPDMKASLDAYMDETGYMNLRVIGTMGMTGGDVTAIGAVRGVTDTEGVYAVDVLSDLGGSARVIHVQSVTGEINRIRLLEGRMPEAANECVADWQLCASYGLSIGDTIIVYSGTEDALADSLAGDTFTITGLGMSPEYLTFDKGTSAIGSGSVAGFIAVDKTAFTTDIYTQVYVRVEALDRYNCFSDEYADAIEELTERIEAIAGERCAIRYLEVTEDARVELADAKQELADAREEADREFADAWQQILDGREEIRDGWALLNDSRADLEEGKADYEEGEKTLYDSLAKIEDGERQLEEAKALMAEKEAEIASARAAIAYGWDEFYKGQEELEAAKAEIEAGEEQLAQLEQAMQAANDIYAEGIAQLTAQRDALEAAKAELTADREQLIADRDAFYAYRDGLSGEEREEQAEELAAREQELDGREQTLSDRQRELDVQEQLLSYAEEQSAPIREYLQSLEDRLSESRKELEDGKAEYAAGVAALESARQQLIDSENLVNAGDAALADGRKQIEDTEKELADARIELADGWRELDSAGEIIRDGEEEITDGERELIESERKLADAIAEYEQAKADAEREFADAESKIADGEAKLVDLSLPEWYVLDRNTVENYVEYDLDAQKIGALAAVFPVLFFFVAALVSLTTMTRMVEEQRTLIGTMKALGYSDGSIAMKYILYALSATAVGSVIGILIGSKLMPWVVITAYGIMYENMPVVLTPIHPLYGLLALLLAVASTVGATWMACGRALTDQPASLMRPVAPAKGKRIFLERIPFLWKHLTFSIKSTLRNLFRYKKRLFMTLFGIGACMALLLVGFGLKDSISTIVNRQYHTIWTYDSAIYLKDAEDEKQVEELGRYLADSDWVRAWIDVANPSMDAEAGGVLKSVNLMVPADIAQAEAFFSWKNRVTGETYALDEDTVLIGEKLATKLSLSVGDTMVLKEDETSRCEVTVGGIVENYLYYYVYISPALYVRVFGETPEWTQRFLLYDESVVTDHETEDRLTAELLELDGVSAVITTRYLRNTISTMLKALDYVVLLLIVSAGLLAFVVLYNLNNINITERKRELATIKLLGFYPGELAAYVYRENILLTLLGIAAGLFMGTWLTFYVIETVEIDMIMFGREISRMSYVWSALITILFSAAVNFVMYFRLQKIDMIESLKSVE